MDTDTGLPDYVGDHFYYLVRCSTPARVGQILFFSSAIVLPLLFTAFLPMVVYGSVAALSVALIVVGAVFLGSFLWYIQWTQIRRELFRRERPASYARWFGPRRPGPLVGFSGQMRLAKMQFLYLFLSREPSPSETLALTMRFVRHSH